MGDATVSKSRVTVLGTVAFVAVVGLAIGAHALLHGSFETEGAFWLVAGGIFLAGIVLHEGVHALGYRWFGGVPWRSIRFGVMWKALMPYAHAAEPMRASGYRVAVVLPGLVTGLLPLAAGLAAGSPLLTAAGGMLLGAAAGDWVVLWAIRGVQGTALVQDHPSEVGAEVLDEGRPGLDSNQGPTP